jgi:gas vesicle protein
MTAAGIAMIIPGVGWVFGGIIAFVGAIFGGIFGNDGRSEAKRKVDSTIDDISEKLLCQLNNGVLKKFKEQYKSVSKDLKQKISTERRNIQTLQSDIENLKEDIKITINQMKL